MVASFRLIFILLLFFPFSSWSFGKVPQQEGFTWTCTVSGVGTNVPGTGSSAISACRNVPLNNGRVKWGPGQDFIRTYINVSPDSSCFSVANSQVFDCGGSVYQQLDPFPGSPACDPAQNGGYGDCVANGKANSGTIPVGFHASGSKSVVCPANSEQTSDKQSCQCMDGFKSDGLNCKPYDCPIGGSYSVYTQTDMQVDAAGDTVCSAGCVYKPSFYKQAKDGKIWGAWPFVASGGTCTGQKDATGVSTGSANEKNPAPTSCAAGMCPGSASMNGNSVNVCVACSATVEPPKTSTTTSQAPDGSASAPSSTSTTKESTSCDGVTCTTTRTTTDGDGKVRQTQTDQKPQQSFCQENPESTICKGGKFSGACASTICNGDAVQCAIAQELYRRNCQLFDDTGFKKFEDLGNSASAGGLRPGDHPNNPANVSDLGDFRSSVDTSDSLGASASCPSDFVGSWMGHDLVISFSSVCDQARILGNLLVSVSWLVCGLIVFRPSAG